MGKSVGETLWMEGQVNGTGSDLSEPCCAKTLGTVGISLFIFPLMHLVGMMTFKLPHLPVKCPIKEFGCYVSSMSSLEPQI